MPKQGFYNGGERMNILLQALLWLGFVVSGLTLWLGAGHISPAIRTWMIPLHSICAGLGFAAAIGHIYLAIGVNPDSFQGMRDGTVRESYAKHHHANGSRASRKRASSRQWSAQSNERGNPSAHLSIKNPAASLCSRIFRGLANINNVFDSVS